MFGSRTAVWALIALFALALPGVAMDKIIRVDKDSVYLLPNGSTWQKTYQDLQVALLDAGYGDEIWGPTSLIPSAGKSTSFSRGGYGGAARVANRGHLKAVRTQFRNPL